MILKQWKTLRIDCIVLLISSHCSACFFTLISLLLLLLFLQYRFLRVLNARQKPKSNISDNVDWVNAKVTGLLGQRTMRAHIQTQPKAGSNWIHKAHSINSSVERVICTSCQQRRIQSHIHTYTYTFLITNHRAHVAIYIRQSNISMHRPPDHQFFPFSHFYLASIKHKA